MPLVTIEAAPHWTAPQGVPSSSPFWSPKKAFLSVISAYFLMAMRLWINFVLSVEISRKMPA
jgi:hypothetical protein